MLALPLQVVDNFLASYNIGDVLILATVLGALAILVQRSNKLFGLHLLTFGLLFMVLPANMLESEAGSIFATPAMYKFTGLALVVLAPVVYAVSRR